MGFADISGQERALEAIQNAIVQERVAHAYLFAGPTGVGKETAARALARALLCREGPRTDGCGQCGPCHKVDIGVHPDVHFLAPEKDLIGIDRVRTLTAGLQYAPFEGRVKVAVVRDAHLMNEPAQNALLKTLEEPPGDAVMVLCAAAPHLLLPTVRSRCQRVVFVPLPDEFILQRLVAATGKPSDDPDLALAVALSDGSLGGALEISEQGRYADRHELVSALQALDPARPAAALDLAEVWGRDRARAVEALEVLQLWYRDRLFDCVRAERIRCMPDLPASRPVSLSEALGALSLLHDARRGLKGYANPQLALEGTLLGLARSQGAHP